MRIFDELAVMIRGDGVMPDPERSDAEVLADLAALSDAGQVQIHMTHVDEGLPVYEVSWRKPGWSLPPHGPDIAAAHHSLGPPVARVLEMARPYIEPPPDPRILDLCDEVDRLRAKNTALARKCEQLTLHSLGCPASPGTSCEFTDHGPCLVHSLRAENTALAATVNELAILFEDHTGAPPHISTGVVEPIR